MSTFFRRNLRQSMQVAALALTCALPLAAQAHRQFLLPSATIFSGDDLWVTVDAAVSNDLFYFENFPLRLDGLSVTAPDGKSVQPANSSSGKLRSSFDLQLTQSGTYRVAVLTKAVFASYKLNGQTKRWRGTAEAMAKEIPADAQELNVIESQGRVETFVTAGKPSAFKPVGAGLELVAITSPNDLVVGDTASFQLLLDGQPAANAKVDVVPGGVRYRDQPLATELKTDAQGKFSVKWSMPGMVWIGASVTDKKTSLPKANERRAGYAVTLEVMP
jgi:uncharacterized GH25 family protein